MVRKLRIYAVPYTQQDGSCESVGVLKRTRIGLVIARTPQEAADRIEEACNLYNNQRANQLKKRSYFTDTTQMREVEIKGFRVRLEKLAQDGSRVSLERFQLGI